jgi:hypothetical protein
VARGPFPRASLGGPETVGDLVGPARVDTSGLSMLRQAADNLGGRVQELAERAAVRQGEAEAAADIAAGRLTPRQNATILGEAYDRIGKMHLATETETAMQAQIEAAAAANPSNPAAFGEALEAIRRGFQPTGFPDLDAQLAGRFGIHAATARARVDAGFRARLADQAKANLTNVLTLGEKRLAQAAQGAPLDGEGDARFAAAIGETLKDLAAFGPKEEFEVAGQLFPADPTRAGMVDVSEIARLAEGVRANAVSARILAQVQRLQGSATRAEMVASLRERQLAGDPMFVGLNAGQVGQLFGQLDALTGQAATAEEAARVDARQHADSLLDALKYGGDVDPAEIRAAAAASGEPGKIQEVEYRLAVGFETGSDAGGSRFDGDPSVAPGFDAAFEIVMGFEGGAAVNPNDNGRGPSKYGLNASANPDLDILNLTETQARNAIKQRYWNAIGGDRLPPELALVAFDAAVNHGPGRAQQMLRDSGGDVGRFLALREAEYRRLAAADPAKYGDDLEGWLNRLAQVRGNAARLAAMAGSSEGFASDPLQFAMGGQSRPARAYVETLPIDAIGSPEFAQALRSRKATGEALANQHQVPARMLTNGEVATLKAQIVADPAQAIAIASAAMEAVGADGARQMLRELGDSDPGVEIHIADLQAMGNANFARLAIEGMAAKAEGAKGLPYENPEDTIETAARAWASALGGQSGVLANAIETAELARIADSQKGRVRSPRAYLESALGAATVNGVTYGGVREVNGHLAVLPPWLAKDKAEEVLEAWMLRLQVTGRGPVYSNGEDMPARQAAAKARLILTPSGRYGLVHADSGAVLRRRDGTPVEIDADTREARDVAGQVPGAVRAR